MTRLHIGLVAPEFPPRIGGMERFAVGLAKALSETDDVVLFTREGNGLPKPNFQQLSVLQDDLLNDLTLLRAHPVDLWLALNAGYLVLAPRLSAPFFAYLHGNDFLGPWIGHTNPLIPWLRRTPYLWRYANPMNAYLRRAGIRRAAESAHRIFTNSKFTAGLIRSRLSVPVGKISVVHPGVDDSFFQDLYKYNGDVLRILSVARLSTLAPKKNIDSCLRALALIGGRLKFKYTVVGDGDDRGRLEALTQVLQLQGKVQFLGFVPPSDMPAQFQNADLLLLASRRSAMDVESFGTVYVEAAACGVPSICSVQGGSIDAVEDGVSGIVIPTSSPEDIAAGILSFAQARSQFPPERVRAFAERFRWPAPARAMRKQILCDLKQAA